MSRISTDDQFNFLLSCIRNASNGKIDFAAVANECEVVSKGAAAKRYERLLKSHGISPVGAVLGVRGGATNDNAAPPSSPKTPVKARKSSVTVPAPRSSDAQASPEGSSSPTPSKATKKRVMDWGAGHTTPHQVANNISTAKRHKGAGVIESYPIITVPNAEDTPNDASAEESPVVGKDKGKGKRKEKAKGQGKDKLRQGGSNSASTKKTVKQTATITNAASSSCSATLVKSEPQDSSTNLAATVSPSAVNANSGRPQAHHIEYADQYDEGENPSDVSTLLLVDTVNDGKDTNMHEQGDEPELPDLESSFTQLADELADAVNNSASGNGEAGGAEFM